MLAVENPVAYAERLTVPLRWWVQGTMLVASLWLAMVVALPTSLAWAFTGIALLLLGTLLLAYGAARITVVGRELRVGRARIGAEHLGSVAALDPEATRRRSGVDADARAHLLLRPYLKRAVEIEVTDPADPTPYWLVSTRHPDRLAAAVAAMARPTPTDGDMA